MKKLRIIVGGFLGILPAGGVTWDYVQYPLGLAQLGHEVYYIEDTGLYPFYHPPGYAWDDARPFVNHLSQVMGHFGLKENWAYRDVATGKSFGLSDAKIKKICQEADVFINVSCSTLMREEYARIPARILLDSDPMFTQIQYETRQSFTGEASGLPELMEAHNYFFTFGENIGRPDCRIPSAGIDWIPTRQPICLDQWPVHPHPDPRKAPFSTLMNWSAGKTLTYEEEPWGQKDLEFPKIQSLPRRFPEYRFSVVINQTGGKNEGFPSGRITAQGWNILEPDKVAANWEDYRAFLSGSFAELSVAKHTYVQARTGWFSCRSACYLACGRPVVTQDTGWSRYLPVGRGLFAFGEEKGAAEAVTAILADPHAHTHAAREVAVEHFDANKVLTKMLAHL